MNALNNSVVKCKVPILIKVQSKSAQVKGFKAQQLLTINMCEPAIKATEERLYPHTYLKDEVLRKSLPSSLSSTSSGYGAGLSYSPRPPPPAIHAMKQRFLKFSDNFFAKKSYGYHPRSQTKSSKQYLTGSH